VDQRRAQIADAVDEIFARGLHEASGIETAFSGLGFHALARRSTRFVCACSRERMVHNVKLACGDTYGELFEPDQEALEITCEYCKSRYHITREDLRLAHGAPN